MRTGPEERQDADFFCSCFEIDPALALAKLGWQPRHSDLDTIIGTALAWETRSGRAARAADE